MRERKKWKSSEKKLEQTKIWGGEKTKTKKKCDMTKAAWVDRRGRVLKKRGKTLNGVANNPGEGVKK